LWGTGRGNYQRTGSLEQGSITNSIINLQPILPVPGDIITYTIQLENPGRSLLSVRVTSTLLNGVTYQGDAAATSGNVTVSGDVITWTGKVFTAKPVIITYSAIVDTGISVPKLLVNTIQFDDGLGNIFNQNAIAIVNGIAIFTPLILNH
jgi:uncharacterized repeat protein (TIGR01451 family)